jgi:hypothetical protein
LKRQEGEREIPDIPDCILIVLCIQSRHAVFRCFVVVKSWMAGYLRRKEVDFRSVRAEGSDLELVLGIFVFLSFLHNHHQYF